MTTEVKKGKKSFHSSKKLLKFLDYSRTGYWHRHTDAPIQFESTDSQANKLIQPDAIRFQLITSINEK